MKNHKSEGKTIYTCPMHPDVAQGHPGNCPECGMHLVPKEEALTEDMAEFTCPMHPEVIQDHPGNCPECGMTLVQSGGAEIG